MKPARVGLMLLAGIAINTLAGAGLSYLIFLANDEQLPSIQFWLLSCLGGACWSAVALVSCTVGVAVCAELRFAGPLDALALGVSQAALPGVPVERVKVIAVVVTALAVGYVDHRDDPLHWPEDTVLCAAGGRPRPPGHWVVQPGGALVLVADAVARSAVQPAELPLVVLTAFISVPFFLLLLLDKPTAALELQRPLRMLQLVRISASEKDLG